MPKLKIKTGDNVVVLSGASKGATGKVMKVIIDKNRAIVEGVNMIKKHTKPSAENPQGGIIEREAPIHVSNLALVDPKSGKPTRVGYKMEDGKKVRYAKKSGDIF
ncbi:50S ribosomal protein L24 [Flavobacteriaceae bacterium UJ101]|nr:50S ribosomal protein L24 [Flavobacteriaceae bacterium UJ101]